MLSAKAIVMMQQFLLVAVSGALGSCLRHMVNVGAARLFGPAFPWGTLGVNVVGCFLMGVFIELLVRRFEGSPELRLLVATGFLGGFTTFSAFALDAADLYGRDLVGQAVSYVAASVILSLAALFVGMWLAKSLA